MCADGSNVIKCREIVFFSVYITPMNDVKSKALCDFATSLKLLSIAIPPTSHLSRNLPLDLRVRE